MVQKTEWWVQELVFWQFSNWVDDALYINSEALHIPYLLHISHTNTSLLYQKL